MAIIDNIFRSLVLLFFSTAITLGGGGFSHADSAKALSGKSGYESDGDIFIEAQPAPAKSEKKVLKKAKKKPAKSRNKSFSSKRNTKKKPHKKISHSKKPVNSDNAPGQDGAEHTAKTENDLDYTIGPGDLLSIRTFGEPDLSIREVRVGGNGKISFPLVGEIIVKGLSLRKLEERIKTLLRDGYLKRPKVSVSILQYRMFYVHGEVIKAGGYNYVDGLTVEKGIALAGGFTERASKSKVRLVRESDPDHPINPVDLKKKVKPGDIIIVGESLF